MPTTRDLSELRFQWLLQQREFRFWNEGQLEQVLLVQGKRPDFPFRTHGGQLILAEVESFTSKARQLPRGRIGAVRMDVLMRPARHAVQHGARQLQAYKELGIPLIVVLDNWRGLDIVLDWPVLTQLLGETTISMDVDTEAGRGHNVHWAPGRHQILHPERKTYVSAVLVNLRTSPARAMEDCKRECLMRVRVLHNPFAAVPLSTDVFGDPRDEQIAYDPALQSWVDPVTRTRWM